MHKLLSVLLLSCFFIAPANAEKVTAEYVPNAQKVGEARMTYMLWDVYDATLYAPQGKWDESKPYALQLKYLRSLDGEAIAARSAEEMRKIGFQDEVKLAAWYSQMSNLFPNVTKNTELVGIYKPNQPTVFYKDGMRIGEIQDAEFGEWFFGIWLNKKTSEPQLRRQLIGLN